MPAMLWIIHKDAPEEFWQLMEGKDLSDTEGILEDLLYSHKKGWITILGCTEKNADDIASIVQEHLSIDVFRPDPSCDASSPSQKSKSSSNYRLR